MSSPKDSDYQIAGPNKVIKKSIVPIIRIIEKTVAGEKELKGTSCVCNVFVIFHSSILVKSSVCSSPSDNHISFGTNSKTANSKPLRTSVLGVFLFLFWVDYGKIRSREKRKRKFEIQNLFEM